MEKYGVFIWRGDGNYVKSEAIKVYKSRWPAERYATAMNRIVDCAYHGGYVVRTLSLIVR